MFRKFKERAGISLLLVTAMLLTACGSSSAAKNGNEREALKFAKKVAAAWDGRTNENTYVGDGFNVSLKLESTWDTGFSAKFTIKNTGKTVIRNWKLGFDYDGDMGDFYNVTVNKTGNAYELTSIRNTNDDIQAGGTVEFGTTSQKGPFKGFPSAYVLTELGRTLEPWETLAPNETLGPGKTMEPGTTPTPVPQATNDPNATQNPTETVAPDEEEDPIEDAVVTKGNQVKKHGRLKVKGRYIVDAKNKAFRIKGISTHGIAWFPEYVNKSAFNSFRKWGANTVRLACYTSQGEGYNTGSVWKTIDKGVKAATDLGMYVIIDWHILNDNNPKKTFTKAKKFFTHFAKKYGKRKNVIWEICNEPNGCSWKDVKSYANKIIPVIRKYSNNIIVCGTTTWSQDVDTAANSPITGKNKKNLCYTIHFYAKSHKDDIRNKVKYAYNKKLPILCTEFSICDYTGNGSLDKKSANTWINLFKKCKIGYITWSLCNKAESSALIKSSCKKKGNFKKSDLTAAGKWFITKLK